MTDKTMTQTSEAKHALESELKRLLNQFESDYGVWVDDVRIDHVTTMDGKKWSIPSVQVEVRLP